MLKATERVLAGLVLMTEIKLCVAFLMRQNVGLLDDSQRMKVNEAQDAALVSSCQR